MPRPALFAPLPRVSAVRANSGVEASRHGTCDATDSVISEQWCSCSARSAVAGKRLWKQGVHL